MKFVKYFHKVCKRLFCHYMRVKFTNNNISDDSAVRQRNGAKRLEFPALEK